MKKQVTKVRVRWFVAVALGLLIVMLFATGPLFYFAKPIRGRIIESGSTMPIQGAIVVADWRMYSMGIGGLNGSITIMETTTNKNGEYSFTSWGPRPRPPWASLLNHSPRMTFFKNGFYPEGGENASENRFDWIRSSEFDGQIVSMQRFDGNFGMLSKALARHDPSGGLGCWRACPLLVVALDAEAKAIRKTAPKGAWFAFPVEVENMTADEQKYFEAFKK